MPDSPAQNNDLLRKLSHDPGTERLATKHELVALLEKGGQTVLAAPAEKTVPVSPKSSEVGKKESMKSSVATDELKPEKDELDFEEKKSARSFFENGPAGTVRPMPILENESDANATRIDLVE